MQCARVLSRSLLGRTIQFHSLRSFSASGHLLGYKLAKNLRDCYSLLGIADDCNEAELKEAFIKLAKQYHPDSRSKTADPRKFAQVEEAYRTVQEKLVKERNKEEVEENKEEDVDIKHTAPQHRQYLGFEGVGYGTPTQRHRQYQQYRVDRAANRVVDYKVAKLSAMSESALVLQEKRAARKAKIVQVIDRLVEDMIAESMANGEFDNLPGKGKPLERKKSEYNPYQDTATHLINKILNDNGFKPQWVELEVEVRNRIKELRKNLDSKRATFGSEPFSLQHQKQWNTYLDTFREDIVALNKRIDKYNMIVPIMAKQLGHIKPDREVAKVIEKFRAQEEQDKQKTVAVEETKVDEKSSKEKMRWGILRHWRFTPLNE
ncbi:dnaJ homolog subfamily C member 28-like [Branchiostoma lanceolatum]|uniref:dnaJ homolog subfamily C member 28-like n=1 Tax=Branchiostoma lanceolatum TaxID=7740 RepID=UPI003451B562